MPFNKNTFQKITLVIVVAMLSGMLKLNAQVDAPGQVWQWSVPVKGAANGNGICRAYMWIPPNCSSVRGMVLAQNNMEELSIIENQQFRDTMTSASIGIIWISPNFDLAFNFQKGSGDIILQLLKDLADSSGYAEIKNVPCVPIGHSAAANFPFAFAAWDNNRTICAVSVSAVIPYDFTNQYGENFWCGKRLDYVPCLTTMGEFEGAGDNTNSTWSKAFTRIDTNQYTPISVLPVSGEYHFATSQRKTNFIAYFIKKAAAARIATPATASALAVLNPINPMTTGWRVDRWQKNMSPRYNPAPVASYTGLRKESYWCFDEDMALRIEDFKGTYFRKTPCLLAYNQSTVAGAIGPQVAQTNNHVQVSLGFYPLNDSLDFELSSSFLDTIPAVSGRCVGWMSTTNATTGAVTNGVVGQVIGKPSDNSLSIIDREIGPIARLRKDAGTGITTFRMVMERGLASQWTNYQPTAIFSVAHPGDATYKASVLQADISITAKNTSGLVQTISFARLPDVTSANLANPIALNATSSLGMPVQYFIKEGPAQLVGNQLNFTTIPTSAKYPVKVTVVAWQWGRNAGLAARTTGTGAPVAGQSVQTAVPVENTFYITAAILPVSIKNFDAVLIDNSKVTLNWETGAEVNSKEFEVQRSIDGNSFTTIGVVKAKGRASVYTLDDLYPVDGINYYRLRSISLDNSTELSKTVSVFVKKQGLKVIKAGNMVTAYGGRENDIIAVTLFNSIGQSVFSASQKIPASKTVSTLLPALLPGVYFIRVTTGDLINTIKTIN